jgi:TolB-like protein
MRKVAVRLIPILAFLFLLTGSFSMAKGPKRMAILPFIMNTDRDLTFLQEGIVDMLASRLMWKGELEVIEKGVVRSEVASFQGRLNPDAAFEIGKRLQADYVILGSLTVFGDSVSVDAKILDVARSEELVTAFSQAKGMDAVIPTVTQFAEDINEKVMGRPTAGARVQQAPSQDGPSSPGGLIGATGRDDGRTVSHTQAVNAEIVSLDAGDVDGDGRNDLVFVSANTVYVYKWAERTFAQFRTYKERFVTGIIWVSVADLDANGRAEIYVSNLGDTGVSSLVLEWDGTGLKKIADGVQWLFRVVDIPGRGKQLIGQKKETGGSFLGDVQILRREGAGYKAVETLPLHRFCNVFNFALVDFDGTGKVDTVMLDHADKLRLYDPGAEHEVWKSDEPFGGTYTFLKIETPSSLGADWVYIPSPIGITDVDGDGKKEVMVCKNISPIGRFLEKMKTYSGGNLHFMTRDAAGFTTKWTTKKLGGAMVGYIVADMNGDKLPELVIATVTKEQRIIGDARSRIILYDLK